MGSVLIDWLPQLHAVVNSRSEEECRECVFGWSLEWTDRRLDCCLA